VAGDRRPVALYVTTTCCCAVDRPTDRQHTRLTAALNADERHLEIHVAWQCAQQLRAVYHQPDPATGRRLAEKIIDSFPSCPIPEVARLGQTLQQWPGAFLAYLDTAGANNGGTEAINGLIELHRRIAASATATTTGYGCC